MKNLFPVTLAQLFESTSVIFPVL